MPESISTDTYTPIALIADDEPLLLNALAAELARAWPELKIVHTVENGTRAIEQLLSNPVDIAFLDIRMPGATGIEVVQEIVEEWPDSSIIIPPLVVFATAYGDYAVDAFDLSAIDYILKPFTSTRLDQTVERLKKHLEDRSNSQSIEVLGERFKTLLDNSTRDTAEQDFLQHIRASVGDTVHIIPIDDVVLFQASDKYVEVHTVDQQQLLIRESLRDLLPKLNRSRFVQVHRSSIVNLGFVAAATRRENGQLTLCLKHSEQQPVVSRLYRHLFQAM